MLNRRELGNFILKSKTTYFMKNLIKKLRDILKILLCHHFDPQQKFCENYLGSRYRMPQSTLDGRY
jgi:hypothetical protein